jgi:hypothetical protein
MISPKVLRNITWSYQAWTSPHLPVERLSILSMSKESKDMPFDA